MRTYLVIGVLLSIPIIAWIPAQFWTLCGNPWCLNVYPDWLDRFIYSLALPYLSQDMIMAAAQMEFLEVWITTVIILEAFILLMLFLFKDTLRKYL